jgi:hypothetical protein
MKRIVTIIVGILLFVPFHISAVEIHDLTNKSSSVTTSGEVPCDATAGGASTSGKCTVSSLLALKTSVSGNAGTATALAANGANCSAAQSPLGVDASGAVEGCWTPVSISGTPSNHYWPGWVSGTAIKGFSIAASKPVCTDASADPAACTSAPIIALFNSGTCSGYLKSDGTCETPAGGGTVTSSGTPTNHQWAGWTSATNAKGFTITASSPVCSDASGDPAVCGGTEGVWQKNLQLLKGTLTDSRLCTYASSGTLLNCNTATSTFQPALDVLKGTLTNGRLCSYASSGTLLNCDTATTTFAASGASTTVNGQTCTLGSTCTVTASLPSNPSACTAGDFVTDIAADGTLTCATPTGTGDVTSVGNCTSGACYDGSSGGGTYQRMYDGTSAYMAITAGVRTLTFQPSNSNAENMIFTFGNNDNTVAMSSSTGATISIGGNSFPVGSDGTYGVKVLNNTTYSPDASTYGWYYVGGVPYFNVNGTGAASLYAGGSIPSLTPVIDDPDNFAANFTGANLYGGTFIANAAGTAALPAVAAGMNFTIVLEGANAVILNPDSSGTADTIYMNGLAAAQDENITSSTSGAMCVFQYRAANTWMATCNGFAEATPP